MMSLSGCVIFLFLMMFAGSLEGLPLTAATCAFIGRNIPGFDGLFCFPCQIMGPSRPVWFPFIFSTQAKTFPDIFFFTGWENVHRVFLRGWSPTLLSPVRLNFTKPSHIGNIPYSHIGILFPYWQQTQHNPEKVCSEVNSPLSLLAVTPF